jgi:hypothetical protein
MSLLKDFVVTLFEVAHEMWTERRKASAEAKEAKPVGLSHNAVAHQQAQIRSAARPWHPGDTVRPPRMDKLN